MNIDMTTVPPPRHEGVNVDTETPPLPGGECYLQVHGAAARVRLAALGVYSL